MRPTTRRLGALAAATTAATVAVVAPGAPTSAAETTIGVCTSVTTIGWSTSGPFSAEITASVSGSCLVPGWTTCDIRLSGVPGVLASERTADYGGCGSSVTFIGLQNTPYTAVGSVGYSAAEAPVHASAAAAVPRS